MNFDEQAFLALHRLLAPATPLFAAVTWLGNGWVQAALVAPLMFFFSRNRFRTHFAALVLSCAVSALPVSLLKIAVDRARPPSHFREQGVTIHVSGGEPGDASFPSGHTQTAFATATFLALLYPPLSVPLMSAALLTGLSRIALGVHFPADVLVGAMIGMAGGAAGFLVNRRRLIRQGTAAGS